MLLCHLSLFLWLVTFGKMLIMKNDNHKDADAADDIMILKYEDYLKAPYTQSKCGFNRFKYCFKYISALSTD